MRPNLFYLHILCTVLCLSACGRHKTVSLNTGGDTITMRYAENLTIVDHSDYTVVTMRNPWDTLKTLHTYILIDKNKPQPEQLPEGTIVRTPIEKAVIFSSVHCGLFDELNVADHIAGICDLQYIKLDKVINGCNEGRIINCGNGMNPDIELLIDLHPDALLISPFENSGGYGRVEKLDIPIIECADYMETSALGRAEWIRFYGRLNGVSKTADSLFSQIEASYLSLRRLALSQKERPTVLGELKNGSAWYIPGGHSTTGRLFADAGANYIFADMPQSGSVPLSFETVFNKGQYADFWFIKYNQKTDKTYSELQRDYSPYAHFKAFKTRHIYGCNTNRVPFYEETPYHPERILKDLIKIMHPGLLPADSTRYFTNLAE